MLCFLFAVIVCVYAQSPNCAPFKVVDPTSGKTYIYNISSYEVPAIQKSSFIAGREASQAWTIYLNVCGNAASVGCTTATPACQGRYVIEVSHKTILLNFLILDGGAGTFYALVRFV